MSERPNLKAALGLAAGATLALGAPAVAGASGPELTNPGPNLAGNPATANQEFDTVLNSVGPDSCLVIQIGNQLGLTTPAARAEFITAGNIKLVGQQAATKRADPVEVGCNGSTPVKAANSRSSTAAYTIAAAKLPAGSAKYVKKTGQGYVLKHAVLSAKGENLLVGNTSRPPKKTIANTVNLDVSFGAEQAVGSSCDPTAGENSVLNGENMSFTQFQAGFNQAVAEAIAAAKAACASNMPPTEPIVTPTPGITAPTTPTAPVAPPTQPPTTTTPTGPTSPPPPPTPPAFTAEQTGDDVSWAQCTSSGSSEEQADAAADEEAAPFTFIDATGGLGYQANSCLAAEASKSSNYSLYVNTGWYSGSSHVSSTSPMTCTTGDNNCLAYNYGYNAGLYAYNAAISLGVKSLVWALDVESNASWSSDTIQNQNSIQGEEDALTANGVKSLIIYSTTADWNSITGGQQNDLESWGATGVTTSGEAATYCMGHEFTGGVTMLIQFAGTTATGSAIDKDYACQTSSQSSSN